MGTRENEKTVWSNIYDSFNDCIYNVTWTEFRYYEWDWYAEDGLNIASDSCEIPYPADFTPGRYTNLKFTDDGSAICIDVCKSQPFFRVGDLRF